MEKIHYKWPCSITMLNYQRVRENERNKWAMFIMFKLDINHWKAGRTQNPFPPAKMVMKCHSPIPFDPWCWKFYQDLPILILGFSRVPLAGHPLKLRGRRSPLQPAAAKPRTWCERRPERRAAGGWPKIGGVRSRIGWRKHASSIQWSSEGPWKKQQPLGIVTSMYGTLYVYPHLGPV